MKTKITATLFCFVTVLCISQPMLANDADEVLSDLDMETFQRQAEKFQERTISNPFSSGVSTAEDLTIEDLILTGIVLNKKQQYALISGYLVSSGDNIAGYRVDSIEKNKVVLRRLDVVFVLSMEGGV